MSMDGRGIAWLPKSLISEELNDGRLVQAGHGYESIPVEIRLFGRRTGELSATESLWRLLDTRY